MAIRLSGSHPDQEAPGQGAAASLRGRGGLSAGRPCPYLGSAEGRGLANGQPSRLNLCYAQPRREWRGFRRVTIPHSRVHREKQAELCFATFTQCPHYQRASEEASGQSPAERPDAPLRGGHRIERKRLRKRSRSSGRLSFALPQRWRTAVRYGAAALAATASAFALTAFIALQPSQMFEYLFEMILIDKIRTSFSMAERGAAKDEGQAGAAGMAAGMGIKSAGDLKNLSEAEKEKLKSSAAAKNLSAADKARIKQMMGLK